MQLICGMIGHQPRPFVARRRAGRWRNRCMVCQRPIERTASGPWTEADELLQD